MKLKSLVMGTAVAVAAMSSTAALAYQAGDIIVRAGAVTVAPDESSDGIAIPALNVPALAGTEAEVDSNTQLGLTATYMLSSSLGIELLAATPFSHDIAANLNAANLGTINAGSTKHLPPTVSLVWYPLGSEQTLSPYLGAGINYTVFFDEKVSGDLEAATGGLAGLDGPLPMSLDLDDSWGVAAQMGVDFAINSNWHVNASVRWIDIETEATFSAGGATIISVENVEIDPWVYQLNIGYKF
ncbi:MAG: outer membrane beta-barrel protein [Porticoccaceae bacterium]|nr:outer membrane beta-barrel protein [Porticoccaceae bacterium]